MEVSISYTKHTNNPTASRPDERQDYWFFPETCTEYYAKEKSQATKYDTKERSQVFASYVIALAAP